MDINFSFLSWIFYIFFRKYINFWIKKSETLSNKVTKYIIADRINSTQMNFK